MDIIDGGHSMARFHGFYFFVDVLNSRRVHLCNGKLHGIYLLSSLSLEPILLISAECFLSERFVVCSVETWTSMHSVHFDVNVRDCQLHASRNFWCDCNQPHDLVHVFVWALSWSRPLFSGIRDLPNSHLVLSLCFELFQNMLRTLSKRIIMVYCFTGPVTHRNLWGRALLDSSRELFGLMSTAILIISRELRLQVTLSIPIQCIYANVTCNDHIKRDSAKLNIVRKWWFNVF